MGVVICVCLCAKLLSLGQNSDAFHAVLADFVTEFFFLFAFGQVVAEVFFACL